MTKQPRDEAISHLHTEDDILIACALRFERYAYLNVHPLDHRETLDEFYRTNQWRHASPLEQLTVFFRLQRFLYKWGGEMLPRTSPAWRAFRSLFLQTHDYAIPEVYRHPEYCARWEKALAPDLARHVALVRKIHETTEYGGHAPRTETTDRSA